MHVLIIDNHDSFTYNLAQAFGARGHGVTVVRSDAVDLLALEDLAPDGLVISPGPGGPRGCGVSARALEHYRGKIPVLGVCLGHQILAASFGATVGPARAPVHGKPAEIHHDGTGIFEGLPDPFVAARYHSLIVHPESWPAALRRSAWTAEGEIMGIAVRGEPTWGVQFHPESFMTPEGGRLLESWISRAPAANL